MPDDIDPNDIVRGLHQLQHGHLERRYCTAELPMTMPDKDRFMWGHPDAEVLGPFFNLIMCRCPHCGLYFTCLPER